MQNISTGVHIDVGWALAKDDIEVLETPRSIIGEIQQTTKREKTYLPYLFMNDASQEQDVFAHYGTANVKKLQAVRAKYDPGCVFQKLVPGGFKLG